MFVGAFGDATLDDLTSFGAEAGEVVKVPDLAAQNVSTGLLVKAVCRWDDGGSILLEWLITEKITLMRQSWARIIAKPGLDDA